MGRVYKTKDGNHEFYVGNTKVGALNSDGSMSDSSGAAMARVQDVQDGAADKPAYQITSKASQNGIDCGDSDQFSFTDGAGNDKPFSLLFVGRVSAATSAYESLIAKYKTTGSHEWVFQRIGPTGATQFLVANSTIATGYVGIETPAPAQGWRACVSTYDGSKTSAGMKVYYDGVFQISTTISGGTYTGMSNTIAKVFVGAFDSTFSIPWRKEFNRAIIFNYVLPEEKIRRYSAGAKLDYDDIGGSMTPINSDAADQNFSSDTGWWLKNTYVTINASSDGKLKFSNGGSSAVNDGIYRLNTQAIGKKYKQTFTIDSVSIGGLYPASTMATITSVKKDGVAQSISQKANSAGVWEFEYTAIGTSVSLWCDTLGTNAVVDSLSVIQLGAVLDLEPENITDTQWIDASPNGLHGIVGGAVANRFTPSYNTQNYIVNGAFDFWQRATSGTTSSGAGDYLAADRWRVYGIKQGVGNAVVTAAQIAAGLQPLHSKYCLRIGINDSGADVAAIAQYIEGKNAVTLAGKTCTLSFKIKRISSTLLNRNFDYRVYYLNTEDVPGSSFLTMAEGTLISSGAVIRDIRTVSTSVWETYSFTFVAPAQADRGLCIQLGLNILSADGDMDSNVGNLFYIGEVMLNEGPVAAPFQRAGGSIAGELALCQRYYERSYDIGVATGAQNANGNVNCRTLSSGDTTQVNGSTFRVTKLKIPTVVIWSGSNSSPTSGKISVDGGADAAGTAAASGVGTNGFTRVIGNTGLSDANVYLYGWTAESEL